MIKYKYNQGDRVYFSLGESLPSGWGKICGIQGLVYIIELESAVNDYPFTHLYIVDNQVVEPPK